MTDKFNTAEIVPALPEGWEIDYETQGGQPNGVGVTEPSDYREWFRPERETHHRHVITLYGPWLDGPTDFGLQCQKYRREEQAREEAREKETYERLRAKFEGVAE